MGLCVLLSFGKLYLDLFQIQKFSRLLESQWQLLLKLLPVVFKFSNMSFFKGADGLLVLGFNLSKRLIPVLIELLVLLNVSLFDFFSLPSLVVD
jgi:hypothetical protein